jgi:hypothetical protein
MDLSRATSPVSLLQSVPKISRRHPYKVSLYLLGMMLFLVFRGIEPSTEAVLKYQKLLKKAETSHYYEGNTRRDMEIARSEYYQSKGWFSCDSICTKKYEKYIELENKLNRMSSDKQSFLREAKQQLGVYSSYAVDEVKQLVYKAYEMGTASAQRMTMFDAVEFAIFGNKKDETLISVLLRLFMQFLVNWTVGLCFAFFAFLGGLYDITVSYGPNFFSGLAFFLLCSLAVGCALMSFLGVIYTGGYYGVKMGMKQILEDQRKRSRTVKYD